MLLLHATATPKIAPTVAITIDILVSNKFKFPVRSEMAASKKSFVNALSLFVFGLSSHLLNLPVLLFPNFLYLAIIKTTRLFPRENQLNLRDKYRYRRSTNAEHLAVSRPF